MSQKVSYSDSIFVCRLVKAGYLFEINLFGVGDTYLGCLVKFRRYRPRRSLLVRVLLNWLRWLEPFNHNGLSLITLIHLKGKQIASVHLWLLMFGWILVLVLFCNRKIDFLRARRQQILWLRCRIVPSRPNYHRVFDYDIWLDNDWDVQELCILGRLISTTLLLSVWSLLIRCARLSLLLLLLRTFIGLVIFL